MAKAIATRPVRTRTEITIGTLTVSVVNNMGMVALLDAMEDDASDRAQSDDRAEWDAIIAGGLA